MNLKIEGLCENILMCTGMAYAIKFCFGKQI